MAEAILRHVGGETFESLSAGSHPAGFVHGLAVAALQRLQVPLGEARSKSWDEFADQPLDVVITVCDNAAREHCPLWQGPAIKAHWSLPDPAYFAGTETDRIEFAVRVAERLLHKIRGMVAIDFNASPDQIKQRLDFLGEI